MQKRTGFTLIELTVVVAIVAGIAVAVFVSMEPTKRINKARNARRLTDITAIAQAAGIKRAESKAVPGLDSDSITWQMLGTGNNCDINLCKAGTDGIISRGALRLNGLSQYASIQSLPSIVSDTLQNFTLSLWVEFTPNSANPLVTYQDSEGRGLTLDIAETNTINFTLSDGMRTVTARSQPINYPTGYYHIAVFYDGSIPVVPGSTQEKGSSPVMIFLNGRQAAESVTAVSLNDFTPGGPFQVGKNQTSYFAGVIDDIRLFSPALEPTRIRMLAQGKDINDGLLLHFDFEDPFQIGHDTVSGSDAELIGGPGLELTTLPPLLDGKSPLFVASQCMDASELLSVLPKDPLVPSEDQRSLYVINDIGGFIAVRACHSDPEGLLGSGLPPVLEAVR